jgi:hypothetical protein
MARVDAAECRETDKKKLTKKTDDKKNRKCNVAASLSTMRKPYTFSSLMNTPTLSMQH